MRTAAPRSLTGTRAVQLSATSFHDPIVSPSLVALEVYEEYAACRDFPVVQDSARLLPAQLQARAPSEHLCSTRVRAAAAHSQHGAQQEGCSA